MPTSTDAEKVFDKFQHPFTIKSLNKGGTKGTSLNIMKATYNKPTANITHSGEKLGTFFSNIRNKTRMPTLVTSIRHSIESPSQATGEEKEIKSIQIGKEKIKLSIFANGMILYVENLKDFIKKLLELISEFNIVAGYKINTQKCYIYIH